MVLWLILAGLTAAAVLAVLWPLGRDDAQDASGRPPDVSVYSHQLAEIDADLERGLIAESEAEAARIEVSRRLLKSAGTASAAASGPGAGRLRAGVMLATMGLVPGLALALYLWQGAPGAPAQPFAARQQTPLERQRIEQLVVKVEEQLRAQPEDGQGWDVIAPVYLRLGRAEEAADAYRRAIRLKGESRDRLFGLLEAAISAGNGIVSEEARAALLKLNRANPKDPVVRFWLAQAKEQDGKLSEAVADYSAMLADAPPDAPWREAVVERLHVLTSRTKAAEAGGPPPRRERGPTAEDVANAQSLSAGDREKMIEGMVAGLAERLQKDGRDLEGWLKLMRAYDVLGRRQDAAAALASARKAFAGDDRSLAVLTDAAKSLGLGS